MTYENFLRVTLSLQKQKFLMEELDKLNLDLYELVSPYHQVTSLLIEEIYGSNGLKMFLWFCYDNDFGQKGLEAFNGCGEMICHSHETLWAYLESIRKEICFETNLSNNK